MPKIVMWIMGFREIWVGGGITGLTKPFGERRIVP